LHLACESISHIGKEQGGDWRKAGLNLAGIGVDEWAPAGHKLDSCGDHYDDRATQDDLTQDDATKDRVNNKTV
jgi:hypothetical protein